MKINFAQVNQEDLDHFGHDELFHNTDNTKHYYFTLEYGTNPGGMEEVAIHDGCNRYMPIAIDNIPEMIAAFQEIYSIAKELKLAERIADLANSDQVAEVIGDKVKYHNSAKLIDCRE